MGKDKTTTVKNDAFSGETAKRFEDLYPYLQNKLNTSVSYSVPLTASMNDTQQKAITGLSSLVDNQNLSDYASGKYLDPSSNPYLQKSLDILRTNANNQFADTAAGIDSRFNNRGFYDSSSHISSLDRAADTANENYNNAATQLLSNQYNQGVGNMLNAQSSLQGANSALLNAGNTAYNIADTDLQRKYQDYLTQQGFNQQDISNLLQYFSVGKNPTQTQTSNDGGEGAGKLVGTIAGSIISCFAAGTIIKAADKEIPIEEIKVGDVVSGQNGEVLTVIRLMPPVIQVVYMVKAGKNMVVTTDSQEFVTPEGIKLLAQLKAGDEVITVDGRTKD